ncbi:hypothetical protein G5714_005374 [Onychostoma macrolepis]|uniref:Ribosomal biogenesis protein LAS1L n=1 Tax=Onychostoma macrolepis TaxID=369639 RepID=A0A7J6D0U8_9TELE|nr:hypothetical protein G5714_005374 [Onychostoma macrolepis]
MEAHQARFSKLRPIHRPRYSLLLLLCAADAGATARALGTRGGGIPHNSNSDVMFPRNSKLVLASSVEWQSLKLHCRLVSLLRLQILSYIVRKNKVYDLKMKKKTVGKTRNIVAWMNKAEYEHVLEYLFSKEPALQKHALHRISAWKGRFGQSTPVAVDSTADLVRCQVLDSTGQLETNDLVLLYGMALVRFVNLITERQQKRVARPLRRLAGNINIPEWVVNLRHDLTHRRLPSLKWCRKGCGFVLDWLHQEYWSRQMGSQLAEDWNSSSEEEDEEEFAKRHEEELLRRQKEIDAHKKVRELLISYEREQFQTYEELAKQGGQRGVWPDASADLSWILTQIKLFATEARDVLIDVLMQDGS